MRRQLDLAEVAPARVDALFIPQLGDREQVVLEVRDASHVGEGEVDVLALLGASDDRKVSNPGGLGESPVGVTKDFVAGLYVGQYRAGVDAGGAAARVDDQVLEWQSSGLGGAHHLEMFGFGGGEVGLNAGCWKARVNWRSRRRPVACHDSCCSNSDSTEVDHRPRLAEERRRVAHLAGRLDPLHHWEDHVRARKKHPPGGEGLHQLRLYEGDVIAGGRWC